MFGVVGWSGAGKTTLIERMLPLVLARGLAVSTMKHAHRGFDIDRPGKDSFRHRAAGASEVLVVGGSRWVLMHEQRDEPEPEVDRLIARMSAVDLLLIEGFKMHPHPKLEVHRPALGKPLLWHPAGDIVAVASDAALPEVAAPVLDLNEPAAIAAFVLAHCGLGGEPGGIFPSP